MSVIFMVFSHLHIIIQLALQIREPGEYMGIYPSLY